MWKSRPDLNWCSDCWFNANIESKETPIGTRLLCLHCGNQTVEYEKGKELDAFKFFSEEQWNEYWEKRFKEK